MSRALRQAEHLDHVILMAIDLPDRSWLLKSRRHVYICPAGA